jgi:hypothetical protein
MQHVPGLALSQCSLAPGDSAVITAPSLVSTGRTLAFPASHWI